MKYKLSKPIFIITTLLILGLIIYIGYTENLFKIEGYRIIMYKTENISCSNGYGGFNTCEFTLANGSQLTLKDGESMMINKFDITKLNLANYGSLLILIIALLLNHYLYNKGYDFKQKIKEIKKLWKIIN